MINNLKKILIFFSPIILIGCNNYNYDEKTSSFSNNTPWLYLFIIFLIISFLPIIHHYFLKYKLMNFKFKFAKIINSVEINNLIKQYCNTKEFKNSLFKSTLESFLWHNENFKIESVYNIFQPIKLDGSEDYNQAMVLITVDFNSFDNITDDEIKQIFFYCVLNYYFDILKNNQIELNKKNALWWEEVEKRDLNLNSKSNYIQKNNKNAVHLFEQSKY